jgi:hypothetical protein
MTSFAGWFVAETFAGSAGWGRAAGLGEAIAPMTVIKSPAPTRLITPEEGRRSEKCFLTFGRSIGDPLDLIGVRILGQRHFNCQVYMEGMCPAGRLLQGVS